MYSGMRKTNKRFFYLALLTTSRLAGLNYLNSTLIQQNNTRLEVIPSNIVANLFHFEKAELFTIENEEARKNVKVSF